MKIGTAICLSLISVVWIVAGISFLSEGTWAAMVLILAGMSTAAVATIIVMRTK